MTRYSLLCSFLLHLLCIYLSDNCPFPSFPAVLRSHVSSIILESFARDLIFVLRGALRLFHPGPADHPRSFDPSSTNLAPKISDPVELLSRKVPRDTSISRGRRREDQATSAFFGGFDAKVSRRSTNRLEFHRVRVFVGGRLAAVPFAILRREFAPTSASATQFDLRSGSGEAIINPLGEF